MSKFQITRAGLFTSLLFQVFCSMAETPGPENIKVSNWLAFLETQSWDHKPVNCHAVVIHPNWALTTNKCVLSQPPEVAVQKIVLRFSNESNQKLKQVKVSKIWHPSTQNTWYPVLLELESPLTPPFPALSFKTHSWFDQLEDSYPLWTVNYLKKNASEYYANRPEISTHSRPVRILDQSYCKPFVKGLNWKICSVSLGSSQALMSESQRGSSVLLDSNFAVTGLGYTLNQENTTAGMNYFIPLGLSPFKRFIKKHTGIEKPRETSQIKKSF